MSEESGRLRITTEDLYAPEVEERVQQLTQAQSIPLVRGVGDPGKSATPWYRNLLLNMVGAGIVGGVVAWGLVEIQMKLFGESDNATANNVVFTMLIGFGIGVVIAVWDGLMSGSMGRLGRTVGIALPVLLLLTVVFGFLANAIYSNWTEGIAEEAFDKLMGDEFSDEEALNSWMSSQLHLPRGVAWSILGIAAGLGVGIASLKWQRMVNGAVGGLVGGFLGGFLFDYFTALRVSDEDTGLMSRAIGLVLTGGLIGLGFGLVELARRQHWLEIVTGGMAGKQFILYSGKTTLGSGGSSDVTLIKDPGVLPQHAVLTQTGQALTVQGAQPGAPVLINGIPVVTQQLRDGDMVQVGSTLLRYRNRVEEKVAAGPILG